MKNTFHGIFSMLLFVLAIVIALISLSNQSFWLALLYLVIIGLCSCGILYAYCAKCVVRLNNCSHVVPGSLTRYFPMRKQDPYTFLDYAGTILSLLVLILFPQYWLLKDLVALLLFWGLAIIATAQILFFVCRQCENEQCLMCPERQRTEDGGRKSEDGKTRQ
jgi:hypothetical protein